MQSSTLLHRLARVGAGIWLGYLLVRQTWDRLVACLSGQETHVYQEETHMTVSEHSVVVTRLISSGNDTLFLHISTSETKINNHILRSGDIFLMDCASRLVSILSFSFSVSFLIAHSYRPLRLTFRLLSCLAFLLFWITWPPPTDFAFIWLVLRCLTGWNITKEILM